MNMLRRDFPLRSRDASHQGFPSVKWERPMPFLKGAMSDLDNSRAKATSSAD